jgi:hypothetical protein
VLGSSIIGLEEHTPENLDAAIDYSVSHDTEFHQFMLYTPIPGTPLYAEHEAKGLLTDPDYKHTADTHGQLTFNYRHPHLPPGMETHFLLKAFARDFEVNGPSVVRMARTLLQGWQRYKGCADRRVRRRMAMETADLPTQFAGAVWASRKYFADQPVLRARIDAVLRGIYREFGWKARLAAPLIGRFIYHKLCREDGRLSQGWTMEPPTFYERAHQPETRRGNDAETTAASRWVGTIVSLDPAAEA